MKPDALRVLDRALVEAVDLELQPVEVELEQQVALKEPRGLVGEPAATELGMDREPAEIRDAVALVGDVEAHQAGTPPFAVLLDLDHEAAGLLRLGA